MRFARKIMKTKKAFKSLSENRPALMIPGARIDYELLKWL